MASGSEIVLAAVDSVAASTGVPQGLSHSGGVSAADVVLKLLSELVLTGSIAEAIPGVIES